uniref:Uncharacterized protein n=1 Tax=Eucampia antarctica TaxID=49252 RepID=A0A7S2RVN1_9STRA
MGTEHRIVICDDSVFRTNTSYFRWNEARSAWGRIINQSRNVMRQGSTWTLPETNPHDVTNPDYHPNAMDDEERLEKIANLSKATWSVPRALCRHLLSAGEDEGRFCKDLRERLDPPVAEAIIASRHRPQRALYYLTNCVDELPLDFRQRYEADKCLVVLIDMIGTCERLYSAPIPLFYTRHAARFLSTWLILLPFALYDPFNATWNHLGMIPCAAIMDFFFFGIEELAVQLEEPFSLLPMAQMTQGIEMSANEFAQWYEEDSDDLQKSQTYNPYMYLIYIHTMPSQLIVTNYLILYISIIMN